MSVPKLRFPGFVGEWEGAAVSELVQSLDAGVSVNSGDRPAKGEEKGVLKTSCVTHGVFDENENKVVDDENEIVRLKEPLSTNTIIISRMNTPALVGANAIVQKGNPNLFLPDRLWAAKIKKTASPEWSALLLGHQRTRERLSERATGTSGSMKNLTKTDVLSLPINLPTLPEQKKIAAFLGAVDAKIAALRARVLGLQTHNRGLMQALFSQTLRFTKPDGTAFPDWEEKRLGEVAEVIGGGTPDTDTPEFWNGNVNWFTPSEIKTKYLTKSARRISAQGLASSSAKLLPIGALILSTRATVGDVGIATEPCATNQGFQSLVMKGNQVNEFWYYWLINNKKAILRKSAGSTFLEIGKSEVSKLPVLVPHPDEQAKIAEALSAMDAKIAAVQGQVDRMQDFKKGLLQQMFV